MKKHLIIIITLISAMYAKAQSSNDTVKINIGSEQISLPMPKDGKKVTVNLEDSTGIIQISIGKFSKNSAMPTTVMTRQPLEPETNKKKYWFREVELSTMFLIKTGIEQTNDTALYYRYQDFTTGIAQKSSTNLIKISPERIYPGLSFGINIKEKRRPIKGSKLTYITGFKFRYTGFTARGSYELTEVKSETKNGVFRYYPDSVLSVQQGNYNSRTNIYQIVFPFMVEFNSKKSELSYAAGLQLVIGANSSKIITKTGENLKTSSMIMNYINPQIIQIQPAFRVNYKKLSAQVSTSFSTTRIGYGATKYFRGSMCYLSFGYRLY